MCSVLFVISILLLALNAAAGQRAAASRPTSSTSAVTSQDVTTRLYSELVGNVTTSGPNSTSPATSPVAGVVLSTPTLVAMTPSTRATSSDGVTPANGTLVQSTAIGGSPTSPTVRPTVVTSLATATSTSAVTVSSAVFSTSSDDAVVLNITSQHDSTTVSSASTSLATIESVVSSAAMPQVTVTSPDNSAIRNSSTGFGLTSPGSASDSATSVTTESEVFGSTIPTYFFGASLTDSEIVTSPVSNSSTTLLTTSTVTSAGAPVGMFTVNPINSSDSTLTSATADDMATTRVSEGLFTTVSSTAGSDIGLLNANQSTVSHTDGSSVTTTVSDWTTVPPVTKIQSDSNYDVTSPAVSSVKISCLS